MPPASAPHLTPQQAADYVLGWMPEVALAAARAHLVGCEACRRLVEIQFETPPALAPSLPVAEVEPSHPAGSPAVLLDDLPVELARSARFRVLEKLGHGGMGVVYKVEQTNLGRAVALKVIRPEFVSDERAVRRFLQEAKAAAQLTHPNIVVTHEVGDEGGLHFIVMGLVDGVDLARLVLKRGALALHQACGLARQIALGLQHAHDKGMVHRDIKPGNVMVTRGGQVTILDFGLARLSRQRRGDGSSTSANVVMGTADYMAPEQALDSRSVDIRADIYSLGCTLYYLLTARPLFVKPTMMEVLMAHATQPPPSLLERRKDAPPALAALLARMLAKSPDDRPATPGEVAAALKPFTAKPEGGSDFMPAVAPPKLPARPPQETLSPTPATIPERKRTRRREVGDGFWLLVGTIATVGLVLMMVVVGIVWNGSRSSRASKKLVAPTPAAAEEVKKEPPAPPQKLPEVRQFANPAGGAMRRLAGGSFWMGSPDDEAERVADAEKQHRVTVSPLYLAETEVTQGQFRRVMGYNPSHFGLRTSGKPGVDYAGSPPGGGAGELAGVGDTDEFPVENLTWNEAREYCEALNKLRPADADFAGWAYRLPTEAEWEYACRAGTTTPFHIGRVLDDLAKVNFDSQFPYGSNEKSQPLGRPRPVGRGAANEFGLFDMHGNVREWCEDWFAEGYYATSRATDPTGPKDAFYRVMRGGCWKDHGHDCRSAARSWGEPASRLWGRGGFRVAFAPAAR